MTRYETIIAGRGARRRAVRVERRRVWTRGDIHAAATAAVEDALFRMGGALSGRDVARILAKREPAPISSKRFTQENGCADRGLTPISTPEKGSGFTPSNDVGKIDMGACRQPKGPACQSKPVGCEPREATKPENQADLSTGVLQNGGQNITRNIPARSLTTSAGTSGPSGAGSPRSCTGASDGDVDFRKRCCGS